MTELVACLSTGKGTWAELYQLIKAERWEKVILVTNSFGKEKFDSTIGNVDLVLIDNNKPLEELSAGIRKELSSRIKGFEVAVNLISGTGMEHMAILGALLKMGVGMRFVTAADNAVKEV